MKKLLLTIVLFGLFQYAATAQALHFGAKGSVNFASVTGDDTDDLEGRTGMQFGLVSNIAFNDVFSVQPELLYSSQGYTLDSPAGEVTGKLDYINLPVMASFEVTEGFSLQGGPQIGVNINSQAEGGGNSIELDAESMDIGLGVGAQFEIPVGVFFQLRYTTGLTNAIQNFDVKNSVFSISAGYFFY